MTSSVRDFWATSLRTKALLVIYVMSGLAGLAMVMIIAGLLLLAAFGRGPAFKIDPWPWLPAIVIITIAAKYAARWSFRKDCSPSA